jgi:hypothetical protein
LSETNPDFGFASGPVDVQWYVDGRAHVVVDAAFVELAGVELAFVELVFAELAEVTPLPVHGRH